MGVDISLHIEIRRQKEWHLMTFDIPLLKNDKYEEEYPIFETEVFNRRYRHFDEFLKDAPSHTRNKKDILSPELQAKLDEDDSFGTFMFDDLEKHCDNLEKVFISGISHAGIFTIKEQLDRIEQKLDKGKDYTPPAEDRERTYEEVTPIEQMYEDFMWDYGCLFRFRDTVRALTSLGSYCGIDSSDIRIFYLIC